MSEPLDKDGWPIVVEPQGPPRIERFEWEGEELTVIDAEPVKEDMADVPLPFRLAR